MRKVIAGLVFAMAASMAHAQSYPDQSISIVVPFAAGGPTDTVARLVGEAMSRDLGQQVIVENVGGAGGTLGAARVAKADPDGYTLLLHHIGMATSATLYRRLPYDPKAAFASIGLVTDVPMIMVARPDLAPTTLGELVQYVKDHKDEVTYANAGIGAASHLCGMLFMDAIDTKLTTVPYKGTGPAMTDLMGGQVDFMCDQTTNTVNQIKGKTIKGYAVTSTDRVPALPDTPTTQEAGLPALQIGVWHGLYAPAGTPADVVERLSQSLQKALAEPAIVAKLAELGTTPAPAGDATPAALQAKLTGEIDRWAPIIQAAGEYAD
jgi:tripartite-type tricarboxylate transporter receptor subunit TctC